MGEEQEKQTKEQLENSQKWWDQRHKRIEVTDVSGPVRVAPPKVEDMPRFPPVTWPTPDELFQKNLEKYRQMALELGAADARIIPASDVPQDLRAYYVGCINPSCRWLNTNANCPVVRTFPFDQMKKFFGEYRFAVVFKVLPPVVEGVPDVGPVDLDMYYTMGGGPAPDRAMLARNIIRLRILSEMERRIRAEAYYDGYLMAAPMGSGPCLLTKCADIRRCPAAEKGGHCRFVDTQPNGAGCAYVNYHALGTKLGWGRLQVGGNCAFPDDVPVPNEYYNIGLILID
ncbi:MAG TPA: hypothetical protein VJ574_06450 [Candidatus Bathyarchaeia archaeon]|nr:MAG: hypothetical protein A3K70_00030 [Candidatus Bathyarchaeota archaeon RBG_16_48_13]HJX24021.1 hypothetical protein [Candidatus Bathyarchaeia archaeon]